MIEMQISRKKGRLKKYRIHSCLRSASRKHEGRCVQKQIHLSCLAGKKRKSEARLTKEQEGKS